MGVNNNTKDIFNLESNVATYWKSFPVEFTNAKGTKIYDKDKNEYLDFMSAFFVPTFQVGIHTIKYIYLK